MKILKSTLCYLLTLLMLAALFPLATLPVSAATTPATVTVAQAQQRIETLKSVLGYVYFTTSKSTCGDSQCDSCNVANIINSSWLKQCLLVPSSVYNFGGGHYSYTKSYGIDTLGSGGWSCYGFASYAQWYIFSQKSTDAITPTLISAGSFNYNTMQYAMPGDAVRLNNSTTNSNGHSFIFLSADSTGVTVLDSNWTNSGQYGRNMVWTHRINYSNYPYCVITRASNYNVSGSTPSTPSISFDITKPSTYPAYPGATLREGASGDYVRFIQTALNDLGYNCGTVNGTYGTSTTNAVKAFQSQHGLTSDGLCGQWTYAEILSVLTAKYNHTHNYSSSAVTQAATCSQSGVRTYYCSCGTTKTEGIPATGHSWGSWVTTKQATSTSTGTAKRTCSKCSGYETKTIAKRAAVKITGYSNSLLAAKNKTVKVSVKAEGDGLVYKWYYKNKGDKTFTRTYSFSGPTYSLQMTSARDGRQVYCIVEDEGGSYVASGIFTLKMQTPLKVTAQPKSVTVAKNKTAKITVKATGDGLIYKWYYKDKGASKFTRTYSFKGASYSVQMNAKRSGRQLYCVIEDTYGNYLATKIVTIKMK